MNRVPITSSCSDERFEINILSQNDEIERDMFPSFFDTIAPEMIVPCKEELEKVYNFLKENINEKYEYADPDHLTSFDFEVQNQCESGRNKYRIDPEEYKVAYKSKKFEFDEFYQIYDIAKDQFLITLILNTQNKRKYVLKHESEYVTSANDLVNERIINDEIKSFPNRNTNKFIELCRNSGGSYLILEKGIIDLELFLKSYNDISLELFLFITNSILQAIKQIHNKKIAHRDIKLRNFVFFKKGEEGVYLKMIDFGKAFTKFEEKRSNFQEDKILDLMGVLRIFNTISQKQINGNSLKIEKWMNCIENMKNLEDVTDFFLFYEIFECKNKEIMKFSNQIFKEYFSEEIFLLGELGPNISDEEKQFFSDNLCLFAMWFDGVKLNDIMAKQFLEREDWKKYIKTIENQLNLFATCYSKEFQNIKLGCFDIIGRKIEYDNIDFIEKMIWNIKYIYHEIKSIQISRIRSSDKIYQKFNDLVNDVVIIKKYFEEIKNVYEEENKKTTKEANIDSKSEIFETNELQNKLSEILNESTTENYMIKRTLILTDYDKKFKSADICDFVSKGLSRERLSFFKKQIGNIRERINYKIKKKKIEARKKHHLIYNNFLQFLEIFLEENPMEQDFLRNKCRKGFKEIIQNKSFVVSHYFKEEFGKNTMIYL